MLLNLNLKGGNMSKYLLITFVCILVFFFSAPVYSAEGLYVSGNIGFAMASDSDITDSTVPGVTVNTEFDTGLAFGAALGYDFNRFRAEGEISYQKNDIDKIGSPGVILDATGDAKALSFLINGYYDVINSSAFTPYISAGIGFAQVEFNDLDISSLGFSGSNDEDTVFAYQIGIGVGYAVTEKVTIDVKYRYFGTEDSEYDTTEAEFASNNFLFGVRVYF
jgi:opacity protein-like surface antigen